MFMSWLCASHVLLLYVALLQIALGLDSVFSPEVKLGASHLDVPPLKHPPPLCLYRTTAYSASITAYERCALPRCIVPSPTIMSRNIWNLSVAKHFVSKSATMYSVSRYTPT